MISIFVLWRFIPARAGNTRHWRRAHRCKPVHPRACGEHADRLMPWPGGLRFIPARAGNTAWRVLLAVSWSVHPRACGEHGAVPSRWQFHGGSSPRVRGTRHYARHCPTLKRFIPARAGNTNHSRRRPRAYSVHPRACGEHFKRDPETKFKTRFIPARAGNTGAALRGDGPRAVHPRACGEHTATLADAEIYTGSSPRVRGTPVHLKKPLFDQRFIPARAGNTLRVIPYAETTAVHPRACGEHNNSLM